MRENTFTGARWGITARGGNAEIKEASKRVGERFHPTPPSAKPRQARPAERDTLSVGVGEGGAQPQGTPESARPGSRCTLRPWHPPAPAPPDAWGAPPQPGLSSAWRPQLPRPHAAPGAPGSRGPRERCLRPTSVPANSRGHSYARLLGPGLLWAQAPASRQCGSAPTAMGGSPKPPVSPCRPRSRGAPPLKPGSPPAEGPGRTTADPRPRLSTHQSTCCWPGSWPGQRQTNSLSRGPGDAVGSHSLRLPRAPKSDLTSRPKSRAQETGGLPQGPVLGLPAPSWLRRPSSPGASSEAPAKPCSHLTCYRPDAARKVPDPRPTPAVPATWLASPGGPRIQARSWTYC